MKTIQKHWTSAGILFLGIAAIGIIAYVAWSSQASFKQNEIDRHLEYMQVTSETVSYYIQRFLAEHINHLELYSINQTFIDELDSGDYADHQSEALKNFFETQKDHVDSLYIINSSGRVVGVYPSRKDSPVGQDYSELPGIKKVFTHRESNISRIYQIPSGDFAISISVPLLKGDKYLGAMMWELTSSTIFEKLLKKFNKDKHEVWLLDNNGQTIAHPIAYHIGEPYLEVHQKKYPHVDWTDMGEIFEDIIAGKSGTRLYSYHREYKEDSGPEKKLISYSPVHHRSGFWTVGVTMYYSEISRPVNAFTYNTIAIAGILGLILAALGLLALNTQKEKLLLEAEKENLLKIAYQEKALTESQEQLLLITDNLPVLVSYIDENQIFQFSNKTYEDWYQRSTSEINGKSMQDVLGEEHYGKVESYVKQGLSGEALSYENTISYPDGKKRHINSTIVPNLDEKGDVKGLFTLVTDISAIKESAEAVRQSEEKYRRLVESTPDWVWSMDLESHITFSNQTINDLLGYSPSHVIGNRFSMFIHPEDQDEFNELINQARESQEGWFNKPIRRPHVDGTFKYFETTAQPVFDEKGRISGFSGIDHDITERVESERDLRALETQLRHSQKMEAIGTLAGGIAHDFNNLLQAITGYAHLLMIETEDDTKNRNHIDSIINTVKRASELIRGLLTFSRKVKSELKPIDIGYVVTQAVMILERTIPKMIKIETRFAENLEMIKGDQVQLEQVVMNMATNARDAMPKGGRLVITCENIVLDDFFTIIHPDITPGKYILMKFEDTGDGIDEEQIKHIFEPFYTTKQIGEGTGLGLAMAYGVIQNHNGIITCESEPGKGTTFKVYLPVNPMDSTQAAPEVQIGEDLPGGDETLLLVDDEVNILYIEKQILEACGYNVLTASSGEAALDIYRQKSGSIDLVLLDIIMPGMDGLSCLKQLINIDPKVKALIVSGYSTKGQAREAMSLGALGFLNKPHQTADMLHHVRTLLDAPQN